MRAVKSRDTKPEKLVQKLAWSLRRGYRVHRADIPGRPDIAYVGAKMAIFVHGCFWHGHKCRRGSRVPKENRDYWIGKVRRNVERDEASLASLTQSGWRTLVIWECELIETDAVRLRLGNFLCDGS